MKKNNTFYSFQRILYNEKACTCWAFHEPLHHEEPIYSCGYVCWCEPGTYVRIWLIDGAVRHMALRLATEQLFGDWCGKGLPAMSNEKCHRTDPKALGPRVPTPCNTQWGSNCVQNWVGNIRITWILFWPGPTLISRLKFCSLWGAGSLTTAFEIGTFILFYTWDTLWHTDTHNWIMYQTLESRDRFCYLKPVWSSTDPWYSWSYSVPCSWGVQSGRSSMCPVDPVPWGWQKL